jgi:diguanylate cyclase (GGDEF)-like protein/PAS domain S-box-containing protein
MKNTRWASRNPGISGWSLLPVAVVLFFQLFLSSPSVAKGPESEPLEEIRLQLKWRHQFQFAGYYAAIEKGFFRNEGLAVELVEGRPDISPVEELLSGRVEFAIDSPAVLIKQQQGLPLVAVAAIFQHSPAVIVTRSDSGLNTPQGLRGKKIMLTPETDPESRAMLAEEGIPLQSIDILPHNWGLGDLIDKRIDGQTAYLTNEPYLLKKAQIQANVIQPLNYGIDFYGDCIITTEEQVHTHFERLQAFRRAVQQGWLYAMAHPRELAELILTQYSREKELDHLLYEAEVMRRLIQPEFVEIGHMNPARWRHIAEIFVRLGMMDADYNLDGFLYADQHDRHVALKQRRMRLWSIALGVVGLTSCFFWLGLVAFNRKLASQVRERTNSLAASEQNFRAFFELASVGVAQLNVRNGQYIRVNKKYCDIVGHSLDELRNGTFVNITHPEDLDNQRVHTERLVAGQIPEFTIEKRYIRRDGMIVWAFLTVSPLWSAGQQPDYILVIIRDITARKNAEERLVFAAKVFENSIEGIVVTDAHGTILQVNAGFSAITGYSAEEAIGENPRVLKSDKHPPSFYKEMWEKITGEGQWAGEIWNRRKTGEPYPEWLTISAVKNHQGKITNFVSIFHDISENFQQQEALKHQAHHDALTGLPNRVLINDRLEVALEKMKRLGTKLALLYLDLDNFKHINDAFGHTAGDHLLIELSSRLARLMRTGDTIARLGGDEFLILLTEVDHINFVSLIAVRLIESLKQPFYHGDIEYFVTGSIGVTIAPDDGSDAITLVKNADIAMYRAKNLGKNSYQFFAPELDMQAHRRIALEMRLRKGLERDEFELLYQPLVHSTSGKIVGAEALVRWRSEGELISPGEFIPLAEDSGLILPLGDWVLKAAARQARKWQDAGYLLAISVNISPRQFAGQDLVTQLQGVLESTGLEPGRLYFEVTESMIMGDLANAQRIMGALRRQGIKFYLDDFGTGYSSLSYLKRLPIDGLKIDRSFIKDIVEDSDSEAIAAAIISLAKTLNLSIVAEGVETDEQWRVLHGMSDMLIQGYLASRPLPADRFEVLIQQGNIVWTGR